MRNLHRRRYHRRGGRGGVGSDWPLWVAISPSRRAIESALKGCASR
ncbi:hypothetical protein [Lysobacter gummosus]